MRRRRRGGDGDVFLFLVDSMRRMESNFIQERKNTIAEVDRDSFREAAPA